MKKVGIALTLALLLLGYCQLAVAQEKLDCWFPPEWKPKTIQVKAIVDSLSKQSGIAVVPRVARSYPEMLAAFAKGEPCLVYVGSFIQAIINARGLGIPLVHAHTGKEFYSGVMIYPVGEDPQSILANNPSEIAFAAGASSGESSAKAATDGKASIRTSNHAASAGAVKAGKAKAGFVKNWWWESNKDKYPELAMYKVPGVSEEKNPDNVLTASNSVSSENRLKIIEAAKKSNSIFEASEMAPFETAELEFSLSLMKKGLIDPNNYEWDAH